MLKFRVNMLAFLLLAGVALGTDAPAVKVAVIAGAGDRAPGTGVLELLMAELSGQAGVTLVEREHIDRILSEQALTALSAAEPANAVRLGQLLAADLLVVVDRLSAQDPVALRLRIIETRTSVVLADLLREESDIASDAALLRERIALALTRWQLPPEGRHYVAILGFRSETLGRDLDGVADALGVLLAADLAGQPSVILLDRQHLDTLVGEGELAGLDVDIQSSAVVISGGIRDNLVDDTWELRMFLQAPATAAGEPVTLTATRGEIGSARHLLAEAVHERFQTGAMEYVPMNPQAEAAMFARQVELLTQKRYDRLFAGEYLRGPRESASRHAPVAEAAFALHPTQTHRAMVASLAPDPRGIELLAEYWREQTRNIDTAGNPILSFTLEPPGGRFSPGARPWPDAMIALQQEMLLRELAWQVEHSPLNDWHVTLAAVFHSFQFWCACVDEWGHYVKSLYQLVRLTAETARSDTSMFTFLHYMFVHGWGLGGGFNPFAHPDQSDSLAQTLDWMRSQDDIALFVASHMLWILKAERALTAAPESAGAVLRHLAIHPHASESLLLGSAFWCLDHIRVPSSITPRSKGYADWQERKHLLFGILGVLVEAGDVSSLAAWLTHDAGPTAPGWMEILRRAATAEREQVWLQRFRDLMRKHRANPALHNISRTRVDQLLDSITARLAELGADSQDLDDEWTRYTITSLQAENHPGSPYRLAHMKYRDAMLIMVWADVPAQHVNAPVTVMVTTCPPDGGSHEILGSLRLVHPPIKGRPSLGRQSWASNLAIRGVERIDGAIYVGTLHDGLLVFDRDDAYQWPDERLQQHHIRAMTELNGIVYPWLSEARHGAGHGVLLAVDPRTRTIREMLSTKRDDSACAIANGQVIEVSDMLGDTARGGIWLCVASGTPAGVLFVEPSSRSNDTADWIGQQRFRRSGRRLDWFGSQIRLTSLGGMSKFDPATDRIVNLLSPAASAFGPGSREHQISAIVGDALITRARRDGVLMLDTGSSGRGALLRTLPDGKQPRIEHMVQVSPDEAIIGDRAGNLWRIVAPEHDRYAARIPYVQPMGDTWQELLERPDRISPANTAASDHHDGHPPDMLVDGNARTCWGAVSESSENWIEFIFDESTTIGSLALLNGWMPDQRGTKRYDANHRARRVRLQYDGGPTETWQLRDVSTPQVLRLPEPITARKVRLTIEAIYEAEIIDAQSPPRLVMSQVMFFQTTLPELK